MFSRVAQLTVLSLLAYLLCHCKARVSSTAEALDDLEKQYQVIGEIERLLAEAELAPDAAWLRGLTSNEDLITLDNLLGELQKRIASHPHHRIARYAAARIVRILAIRGRPADQARIHQYLESYVAVCGGIFDCYEALRDLSNIVDVLPEYFIPAEKRRRALSAQYDLKAIYDKTFAALPLALSNTLILSRWRSLCALAEFYTETDFLNNQNKALPLRLAPSDLSNLQNKIDREIKEFQTEYSAAISWEGSGNKVPDHLMSLLYYGVTQNDKVPDDQTDYLKTQIEEIYSALKLTHLQNLTVKKYGERLHKNTDLRSFLKDLSSSDEPNERFVNLQTLLRFHSVERYHLQGWDWVETYQKLSANQSTEDERVAAQSNLKMLESAQQDADNEISEHFKAAGLEKLANIFSASGSREERKAFSRHVEENHPDIPSIHSLLREYETRMQVVGKLQETFELDKKTIPEHKHEEELLMRVTLPLIEAAVIPLMSACLARSFFTKRGQSFSHEFTLGELDWVLNLNEVCVGKGIGLKGRVVNALIAKEIDLKRSLKAYFLRSASILTVLAVAATLPKVDRFVLRLWSKGGKLIPSSVAKAYAKWGQKLVDRAPLFAKELGVALRHATIFSLGTKAILANVTKFPYFREITHGGMDFYAHNPDLSFAANLFHNFGEGAFHGAAIFYFLPKYHKHVFDRRITPWITSKQLSQPATRNLLDFSRVVGDTVVFGSLPMIGRGIAAGWHGVMGEPIDRPIWQGSEQLGEEALDGLIFALAFRASGLTALPVDIPGVKIIPAAPAAQ